MSLYYEKIIRSPFWLPQWGRHTPNRALRDSVRPGFCPGSSQSYLRRSLQHENYPRSLSHSWDRAAH